MSLEDLSQAIIVGNRQKAIDLTEKALADGTPPPEVIYRGLVPGMDVVGEKFRNNEYYIPNVLVSARAMSASMELLKPLLVSSGMKYVGKAVIGTVEGDLHDIGKNLVRMMLQGGGFDVLDLGVDVSPDKFVQSVKEFKPELIAMSALLTTTMPGMKKVIEKLNDEGIRGTVKVMIGGAPITQRFADQIGADAFASDASSAVLRAKELLGVSS